MCKDIVSISKVKMFHGYFEAEVSDKVFILGTIESQRVWKKMVHSKVRHVVFIPDDHWLSCSTTRKKELGEFSLGDTYIGAKEGEKKIRSIINWDDDDEVFFFAKEQCVLMTKWSVFLASWQDFMNFEDEFSILMRKDHCEKEALRFNPNSSISYITG